MSGLVSLPPGAISRSIRAAIREVVDPELAPGQQGMFLVRAEVEAQDGTIIPRLVVAAKVGDPTTRPGEWKFAIEGEGPVDGTVRGRASIEGRWTW